MWEGGREERKEKREKQKDLERGKWQAERFRAGGGRSDKHKDLEPGGGKKYLEGGKQKNLKWVKGENQKDLERGSDMQKDLEEGKQKNLKSVKGEMQKDLKGKKKLFVSK